jgi:hypothetical protein
MTKLKGKNSSKNTLTFYFGLFLYVLSIYAGGRMEINSSRMLLAKKTEEEEEKNDVFSPHNSFRLMETLISFDKEQQKKRNRIFYGIPGLYIF